MSAIRAVDRLLCTPELILMIVDRIDSIQTLISFRHTCRTIRSLTTTYENSISQKLAHAIFPDCIRLRTLPQPELYTIPWLINLVPRHLASILVDRHRVVHDEHMYGIPCESPHGDRLRARVANGWRILRKLSLISQRIHNIAPPAPPSRLRSQSEQSQEKRDALTRLKQLRMRTPPDVAMTKQVEHFIYERRLEYVKTLKIKEKEDYQIMSLFLVGTFEHLWGGPAALSIEAEDGPLDFGRPPRKWIGGRRNNSWVNWYMLHHGPELFWEQWWAANKQQRWQRSAFKKMKDEWDAANEMVIEIQREYSRRLEKELMRGTDVNKWDPVPECAVYDRSVELRDSPVVRTRRDPLGCVPFRVDETFNSHLCEVGLCERMFVPECRGMLGGCLMRM